MTPAGRSAAPTVPRTRAGEFAALARTVRQAGPLRRRHGHHLLTSGLAIAVLAATGVVFAHAGNSWWRLFTAAVLALVCTQLSFIEKDSGTSAPASTAGRGFPHQGRWSVHMGCSFAPNRSRTVRGGFRVDHNVSYSECGLLRSYGHVLRHLHAVGAPARSSAH
jgi:hypothetical protein